MPLEVRVIGGVERGMGKGPVENAGVDLNGCGGGRRLEVDVAPDLIEQARADAEASGWCRIATSSVVKAPSCMNVGWRATLRSGEVRNL